MIIEMLEDPFIRVAFAVLLPIIAIFLGLVYKGLDRKLSARLTSRIGPPIRQPFRDVRKLFLKENIVPENSIPWMFNAMPLVAMATSLTLLLYIPFGPFPAPLEGRGDLIVLLYLLAMQPLAMALGGFASGSPYASVGAQREMVLMMSYEVPLATIIVGFAYLYASVPATVTSVWAPFSLGMIAQTPVWGLVGSPVGLIGVLILLGVLLVVTPAELVKIPFDIAEAETEIAEGLLAEYSGRNLAMFYISDAVRSFAMCAIVVVLFFPHTLSSIVPLTAYPWNTEPVLLTLETLWFLLKVFIVYFFAVTLVRTSFARIKVDQAAKFFWLHMTLAALFGLLLIYMDVGGWF